MELATSAQVTVVSVSYNSMAVLPAMLESVPKGTPVVVVDNASQNANEVRDLCNRTGARLIRNTRNVGFGSACNQGAALADTEYLLFLNPDAMLMPDCLTELVAAALRYKAASGFNPRLSEANGAEMFQRRSRFLPAHEILPRGWPKSDREVPILSGAALFVRRKDFNAVGGFDPLIFLYHEDDDLSLRLRKQIGPLMFIRNASVQHLGGSSSARSPEIAALKAWFMSRSLVYTSRKHGLPYPFAAALLIACLNFLAPDMLFSRRRRAKTWAFFLGVLSTRRDGGVERTATE